MAALEAKAEEFGKRDPSLFRKAIREAHRRFKSSIDRTTVEVSHDVTLSPPVFADKQSNGNPSEES